MKGTQGEGFQKNFINQVTENSALKTSKSTETDKTGAVQHPVTPVPLKNGNIDTDEIKAINNNSLWEWMSNDKVRLLITIPVIGLFLISVIVGLIIFILTGNALLLFGIPVLYIPVNKVLNYYFPRQETKYIICI